MKLSLNDLPNPFVIRVTPKASRNKIAIAQGDDDIHIKVYVTTVPEGGKANADVIKLLSKALGVPKSSLAIVRGETSRDKVIKVDI